MKLLSTPATPWRTPEDYWQALADATHALDAPYGVLSLEALSHNAADMIRRASGVPIRVASKSIRVREVMDAVLELDEFRGVLAYTLTEALWLAETIDDVVVGYPSVDRAAIAALGTSPALAERVTLMIDSVEHLDFVDSVLSPQHRETIRVCIDVDASFHSPLLGHVGAHRSPVRSAAQARTLASTVVDRAGFTLVGIMAYEAQIAGVGNRPPNKAAFGRLLDVMQTASAKELRERRGEIVTSVSEIAELEFVNGGGTGSLESTAEDTSVTEIAAGSGLFGPHLFDNYSHFTPAPAAAFALAVDRKYSLDIATVHGGGWIASGEAGVDRMPQPTWPEGLKYVPREGAGEVQSPLTGPAAEQLEVGDRVWFRHTKAGELSEHLNEFAVVADGRIVDTVPTYRGEGKAFL
ncbi:D-serine deaminase-like pyridoxal phosphate-dependent protein [Salinibacterium amurskyense]|uniref:D-serine deaminase-like pyridoxal phosphate-dependent protein n=1 Tax=Salinibacterium amurskyense TaxID=205941 RepID=A0A2M9D384_9MICO|nr:amino acid deaminase/aldolase [Salinibacterium amurskyense]PJJ78654.1 D-serine deaminase-like pyridoxal phosphate-dependent protein [Salinibacterium amurskyense]RLQ80947.1 amino acid deaminase/aldolase [Salinibacterium amurskyense]GHD83911.1 alanine racemase [Salinibacterium amurskyense]